MNPRLTFSVVDPQGPEALALLREAALEACRLYGDRMDADAPMPGNAPAVPRSVYLVAWKAQRPVGCAALRPVAADPTLAEVRRMFVCVDQRRSGIARALLERIEADARTLGYTHLRLETGDRQHAAMALYAAMGYTPIAAYDEHVADPTSRCYGKALAK